MSTAATIARLPGPRRWLAWFEPRPGTLLSPGADVLMAGGASIILFVILKAFVPKTADTTLWAGALYYASFLVNYPHFAASYQLLYRDAGKYFFAWRTRPKFALRLWWAGVIVPLLVIGYFAYALSAGDTSRVGYVVNAMFFFVGWHYVKQIFGCVIVLSAARDIRYSDSERRAILAPLYSLWLLSYANSNSDTFAQMFGDIPYTHVGLPAFVFPVLGAAFIFTSLRMIAMFGRRFEQNKPLPPLSAVAAILSIYIWLMPVHNTPYYRLIIPFFHSLQYLLFVLVYKRNEAAAARPAATAKRDMSLAAAALFIIAPVLLIGGVAAAGLTVRLEVAMLASYGMLMTVSSSVWMRTLAIAAGIGAVYGLLQFAARKSPLWHFLSFVGQILLLGAVLFSLAPTLLDILAKNALLPEAVLRGTAAFGTAFFLFAFSLFVNIHHYFVDNVLWGRDNPNIREHLFH